MPSAILTLVLFLVVIAACLAAVADPALGFLDLRSATVIVPPNLTGPENRAIAMLVEEVEKRTQIRWPVHAGAYAGSGPVIAVGPLSALSSVEPAAARSLRSSPLAKKLEGYQLRVLT